MAALSRWLQRNQLPLLQLDEKLIAAFLKARRRVASPPSGSAATIVLLLRHLRQAHIVASPPPPPAPCGDIALVEEAYENFLLEERSLARASAEAYLAEARRFLVYRFPGGKLNLERLRARDVTDFILHDEVNRRRHGGQLMASALRSFLHFLFQKGRVSINLSTVVPMIPSRRLSQLPRYLEPQQVEKLLRCCDRRSKIGKRDYAILLLSARLGVRAGEVVRLTLDDIDWRAGELLVRGKRARMDRLPLVNDVGRALVDYLRNGRPDCSSRRVFLRCNAPYGDLAGPSCIYRIVQSALGRADLHPPHRGVHLLRHSLATTMLRHGASLAQIGQVLRHQLPQTTEIYAKVDLNALRGLALPWHGGDL